MAAVTVKSDAYLSGQMPDRVAAGVPLCRSAKYINSGAKDANSVIQMVLVPAGAKLLNFEWKTSALGAGVTADFGTSGDVDKYVDGADVSAAITGAAHCINEDLTEDTGIQMKVLGGPLPDGARIDMNVWYKMSGGIADED